MTAKIIEMPKSNAQLWRDLFNSFLRGTAEPPAVMGHVGEDGGWIPDKEEK